MTKRLYSYKELKEMIISIELQIENSTIDPKPMIDWFNNKKIIEIHGLKEE